MNIFIKSAVLTGKILILAVLLFLFYAVLIGSKGDNLQLGIALFILIFILVPAVFIMFFKKGLIQKHPNFIKPWKVLRIIYVIIITLFIAFMIPGLYKFYEVKSSQKTIDFINSKKITLDDVMGTNLPPIPDQKLNDSTIAGIDANNNYIRDDVELAIFQKYPDSAKIRAAELQYAQEIEDELINVFNNDTWVAMAKNENNGISCIIDLSFNSYKDIKDQIRQSDDWMKETEALVFNTNIRKQTRDKVDETYQTSYVVGDGKCDIDFSTLPN